MSADKQITSDDLFKIAASLTLVGDSLALLSIEKAVEESAISAANARSSGRTESSETKNKRELKLALNKIHKRLNG